MFGIFNSKKKKKKKDLDFLIFKKMKDFSDETENAYNNFIGYTQVDYPNEHFDISPYGLYKARLGTCLMIALGAQFTKAKIGYASGSELFNDIQLATAIAHTPFRDESSPYFLEKSSISNQTEEIIKYIIDIIQPYQKELYESDIIKSKEYFRKLKIYFHSSVSESIANKEVMKSIINKNKAYFENLTSQHLNIMVEFMRIEN